MPTQYHYSHNSSRRSYTDGMSPSNAIRLGPTQTMAMHGSKPRLFSLGSPPNEETLHERHDQDMSAQTLAEFCGNMPPQCDLTKLYPRNHDTALAATLSQLDNFLASRNICRSYLLRLCSVSKCGCIHDAVFRDGFMAPLFGDVWRDLGIASRGSPSDNCSPRNDPGKSIQINYGPELFTDGIDENRFGSGVISFEPSSVLDVATGLYVPSSMSAARAYARGTTEMEFEKSELQVESCSDDLPHPQLLAAHSRYPRPHRRRGRRLCMVRDRMSLWGKSAWKKSVMTKQTKQTKKKNESEVALAR